MLERLRARDPDGRVAAVLGDMVDDLPAGPFDAVLVAYNSLFNLEDADRQAACFAAVAARLAPGGAFVVEAFVPEDPPRDGTVVAVRSMTADEVVLSISEHDPGGPARRRPPRAVHRRRAGAPAAVGDPLRPARRARRDGGGGRPRARRALGGLRAPPVRRRQRPARQRVRAEQAVTVSARRIAARGHAPVLSWTAL